MSQSALLRATRDAIKTLTGLTAGSCEVMFDGQPKPSCGEQFIAVWPGSWAGDSGDDDLTEVFGVNVTLTRRTPYAPQDRQGTEVLLKLTEGMEPVLRSIIVLIHKSQAVRVAANVIINADTARTLAGFDEPLLFRGCSQIEVKGPDWFCADSIGSGKFTNAGAAITASFVGAKRIQGLAHSYDEG